MSEYLANARAFAPPLRRECVLIQVIGIPLLVGYWSSVAEDFNAWLMCLAVTSALTPFAQHDNKKVVPVPP